RLADGTHCDGTVVADACDHDLALVRIAATALPAVRWGPPGGPRVGQLIASLGRAPCPLHYGVVGALHVGNPGVRGYLPVSVKPAGPSTEEVAFAKFLPSHLQIVDARPLLREGDVITHLDGVP